MSRYNIALIPATKEKQCVRCASYFAERSTQFETNYLLGDTSFPHITLVQFRTDDQKLLAEIWNEATNKITESKGTQLVIRLVGPTWIHDFKRENFIWLQLMPTQECLKILHALHKQLVEVLNQFGIKSINRSLSQFDPHLTLAHTTNLSRRKELKTLQQEIVDVFCPILGLSDEIGQLTEILKSY